MDINLNQYAQGDLTKQLGPTDPPVLSAADRNQLVSVLQGYKGSKEELERQLRKAGWLDEQ